MLKRRRKKRVAGRSERIREGKEIEVNGKTDQTADH